MVKYITLTICLYSLCSSVFSQALTPQVLGSGGGSVLLGGYQIDYTIGELAIQTAGSGPVITEGFEQPEMSEISLPVLGLRLLVSNEKGYAHLYFSTVQEFKTAHYIVERSMDGQRFDSIYLIQTKAPQGNSATPLSYNYTDPQMIKSVAYYRITQVDQNGNLAYSSVVSVKNTANPQNTLKIFPNPASSRIQVQIGQSAKKTKLRVYSMAGHLMFTKEIPAGSADALSPVTIQLERWPAGIYVLETETEGSIQRAEFIKK